MKVTRVADMSDRGSGSVWTMCSLALLSVAASMLTFAGGVARAQMRAAAAADVAALRAADLLQHRHTAAQACSAAAALARANAAEVSSCEVTGEVVVVQVAATAPGVIAFRLQSRARAGPV